MDEQTVLYDTQTVRPESVDGVPVSQNKRRGISFFTKNVGNMVALRRNSDERDGLIVATTHLFWHPRLVVSVPDSLPGPRVSRQAHNYVSADIHMNVPGTRISGLQYKVVCFK